MLKKIIMTVLAIMSSNSFVSSAELNIVNKGKSEYAILIDENALDSVKAAADELQQMMKKVSGAKLNIVYNTVSKRKYISIGANTLTQKIGISADDLKKDGFLMVEKDGNIFLLGNDEDISKANKFYEWSTYLTSDSVGSYFATIEFIRLALGVEWYMPTEKGVVWRPKKKVSVNRGLYIRAEPRFRERLIQEVCYRSKKQFGNASELWGRHMLLGNGVFINFQHAWFYYIPAKKPTCYSSKVYGKTHPEYYALVGGARQNYYHNKTLGGQLCVSNPAVAETYAKNIISYAKKTGQKAFSLSQNDGGGQCECENCRKWDGVDPVTGEKVLTNRLLRFVNHVAALVVQKIPDARLGFYAYQAGVHPPLGDIKTHPNVYISDVYNALPNVWDSGKSDRNKISDYISAWRKVSKHVVLTSYYNIYGNWGLPWDTTDVSGEIVKKLSLSPSSEGVRIENLRSFLTPGLDGARVWVLARQLWNPKQDYKKLRNDYYTGAFGENAGKYIQEYFDTINDSAKTVMNKYPTLAIFREKNIPMQCTYPEKIYNPIREKCAKLIQKAKRAVEKSKDKNLKWRVSRIALGWRFTELTLDSVNYAKIARTGNYGEMGLTQKEAWQKAVAAGIERQKLLNSPANAYAVSKESVDICKRQRPIGVVEKMPENINLKITVPLKDAKVNFDGKLDDEVWSRIKRSSDFRDNKKGKTVVLKTWVKAFRTNNALIIGFHCDEPLMEKLKCINDSDKIYTGDVAEIFMSQTGSQLDYVHFLINPNSVKKAYIMRGDLGLDHNWKPAWQAKSFRGEDFWSTEIRIPFKTISLPPENIVEKTVFVDFFRERYAGGNAELYAYSPTTGGFAQPSKFARIEFNAENSGARSNSEVNILSNGSFEEGLRGWELVSKCKVSVRDGKSLDGKKCALIEVPDDGVKYIALTKKIINLESGRTYCFEAWMKSEGFDGSRTSGASLRILGGKGISGKIVKPSTWQMQRVSLTLGKGETSIRVYVRVRSNKSAKVWLDKAGLFLVK